MQRSTSFEASRAIGKLCVGGDWACANGDLEGLRHVARQLVEYMPARMHGDLSALVNACEADPDRAVALWSTLKTRLYRAAS